ncbi:MAG: Ig-like domain-containing protein [Firmicutes bacterium]|nr:Ig-like domain-containing protein [Bacillota bacterium]
MKSNIVTVDVEAPLTKITLTGNSSVNVGSNATFTATAYSSNVKLPDINITLYEVNTKTNIASGKTNSNGEVSFSIKFDNAGDYSFYAYSGDINSNTVNIIAKPVCNSEQYYCSILNKCICYSDNASNITLTLKNANPEFLLFNGAWIRDYYFYLKYMAGYGYFIGGNSCPTSWGNAPNNLPPNIYFRDIDISGIVTDANGNACGDTGVCQKYKLYFWLNEYTLTHTFYQCMNDGYNYYYDFDFNMDFTYEVLSSNYAKLADSNGIQGYIYADEDGKFDIKLRVYANLSSYSHIGSSYNDCSAPEMEASPILYAGFSEYNTVAVQTVEYTVKTCKHLYWYDQYY